MQNGLGICGCVTPNIFRDRSKEVRNICIVSCGNPYWEDNVREA
jgi:hypothetical protein